MSTGLSMGTSKKNSDRGIHYLLWGTVIFVIILILAGIYGWYIITSHITLSGKLAPGSIRLMKAPAEGTLEKGTVSPGEIVAEGDILGRISSPELGRKIQDARYAVKEARVRLDEVQGLMALERERLILERDTLESELEWDNAELMLLEDRRHKGEISQRELETARRRVGELKAELAVNEIALEIFEKKIDIETQRAKHQLASRTAGLEELEQKKEELVMRAPFAGVVLETFFGDEEEVSAGADICRVADMSNVEVVARVDERDAQRIAIGSAADIEVGYKNFDGEVVFIAPLAAERGLIDVHIALEDAPKDLRVGTDSSARIRIR